MAKVKRKPRPSMPVWWWWGEPCFFCKNENNCNQCKAARSDEKLMRKKEIRKRRREIYKDGYE